MGLFATGGIKSTFRRDLNGLAFFLLTFLNLKRKIILRNHNHTKQIDIYKNKNYHLY